MKEAKKAARRRREEEVERAKAEIAEVEEKMNDFGF
jgi:hypothetical protein